jgi:hypothetical protein
MPADPYTAPAGHSLAAHRVHGWCAICRGRTALEELAEWRIHENARHRRAEEAEHGTTAGGDRG